MGKSGKNTEAFYPDGFHTHALLFHLSESCSKWKNRDGFDRLNQIMKLLYVVTGERIVSDAVEIFKSSC